MGRGTSWPGRRAGLQLVQRSAQDRVEQAGEDQSGGGYSGPWCVELACVRRRQRPAKRGVEKQDCSVVR